MAAVWASWWRAGRLTWQNLTRLIGLNVLWIVTAWPLVTLGPATFAAYWWITLAVRDGEERAGFVHYLQAMRRYFGRGLVWALGWALVLGLAWASFVTWPRFLPPWALAAAGLAWLVGLALLAAAQPYLLEALVVQELPWGEALRRAGWATLANPLYSHVQLLVPAFAVLLCTRFTALPLLVLGSIVLLFGAVAAVSAPLQPGGAV